jgi:hypothetical protein
MEAARIDAVVHERFEVRERLGEGGFGTVWAAWDRELDIAVALKQLRQLSPEAIYRFKKEFRLLATMAHPNLVSLFELFQHQSAWYFTMELVPGHTLLTHLRPDDFVPIDRAVTIEDVHLASSNSKRLRRPGSLPKLDDLRVVFAQLARALCALHEAGLLHRDVKPSNVLVTPDHRVVVLDFGLATQTRPLATGGDGEIVGTPMYMSPEQWMAAQLSEASDWYSFGVVLYEALTGIPPFDGSGTEIAMNMLARSPVSPRLFNPDVPEDLSRLCDELLSLKPEARPSGSEVLRRLGGDAESELHTDRPRRAFVGRAAELARLHKAFTTVRQGTSLLVEVVGESGLGKSALCEHFLGALANSPEALVLSGRCYEQESLPYKALDGVIDELSRVLLRQWHVNPRWPEHVGDLARLFPVLGRVPGFQRASNGSDGRGALEVRRGAVQSLRDLLHVLGRQQRIVMFLDDVQWGDADSPVVLHQLMAPPDPPPLLIIVSYRGDEAETSQFLRELRALDAASARPTQRERIELGRFSSDDSERLALELLSRRRTRPGVVTALAREAAGNPLMLEELVRFTHTTPDVPVRATAPHTPDEAERSALFENMVEQRIRELPEPWQKFLAVVGLASRPVELETARAVAGLPALDRTQLNRLRTGHLLRTGKHDSGRDVVAPYHDRIREIVAGALDDSERKRIHLALADAFADNRRIAPGLVATHLYEAGELDRAADYALRAAEQAETALAFDEAAELYGKALEWRKRDRAPLHKYANALANAGRCAQAAPRYLEAAALAHGTDALILKQRACEQYLIGGQNDEGMALLDELCAVTRLPRARSRSQAMLGLAADYLRLRLRGYDFEARGEAEMDAGERFKIDLCFSATRNLLLTDPMAGTRFSTRALLLALHAGEPARIVEGLASVGSALAAVGAAAGHVMLARARTIADELGTPYVLGLLRFWSGYVEHTSCRWTQSLAAWDEAAVLLRQCRGVQGEIQKAELNAILAVQLLGRFDELTVRTERAMSDARASGNLYTELYARLYSSIPPLAAGDAAAARARIREARARAPWRDHYVQITAIKFECFCDLYEGRPAEALQRLNESWPTLQATRMMATPLFKLVFHGLRAFILLALRAAGGAVRLERAEADADVCGRIDMPYARGQTALLRAAIHSQRGQVERAVAEAERAAAAFSEAGLDLEVAYARRRRGQLAGATAEVVAADALMRGRGVADPARWTESQAPGFVF